MARLFMLVAVETNAPDDRLGKVRDDVGEAIWDRFREGAECYPIPAANTERFEAAIVSGELQPLRFDPVIADGNAPSDYVPRDRREGDQP